MAWTELRERNGSNHELKSKVKKVKELIMDICEDLEESGEYGERNYMERRGDYGERRGYRIEEDDRYGERNPYSRRY